jgi:hypothetical protein
MKRILIASEEFNTPPLSGAFKKVLNPESNHLTITTYLAALRRGMLIVSVFVVMGLSELCAADFSMSFGAGGLGGMSWRSASISAPGESSSTINHAEDLLKAKYLGGGLFGFFDATYVQVNVGVQWEKAEQTSDSDSADSSYLNLGLFGKFPFEVGDILFVYPMLGIQHDVYLSTDTGNIKIRRADLKDYYSDKMYFDNLWIKVGAGLDVNFSDSLFLKVEALWGFKLNNRSEKYMVNEFKDAGYTLSFLHHGPTIKLALGYRIGM